MSQLRPYPAYVRAGDTFTASLSVAGYPLGVSQNAVFGYLQTHNLLLVDWVDSQWGYLNGGPIRLSVLALTDFSHVADVADAVAQSFGDAGYSAGYFSNWNQTAQRAFQVPDSVSTADATAGLPGLRATSGPTSNVLIDELSNIPRDVGQGLERVLPGGVDAPDLRPVIPWALIAVAAVAVLFVLPKLSSR
jgi:hypothetical protein